MLFLFKVVVLFLIVFNFRLPVIYSSATATILMCTVYYFFKRGSISFTFFFQRYNAVILIGTVLLAYIITLYGFFHHTDIMPGKEMRIWIEFMMLGITVYALPLLVEGKESTALEEIALIICYAFAIQGCIDFAAYLYAPLGDFLFNMKPEYMRETVMDPAANMARFRLYNLSGSVFVELTASFGVAFVVFFWLMLKSNHPYISGWKKYAIFFFIFMGTTFAGRTGFIGLLIGLGGWLFFSFNRIFTVIKQNTGYIITFFVGLFFVYNFVFSENQRDSFSNEVFPFAFEWYYNYRDNGRLDVASANATTHHYYYVYDATLLKGLGKDPFGGGTMYPHSDAGYMNNLVFGGIPFLICLFIYQSLYFITPINITRKIHSRNNQIDAGFFLLLFLYIAFVEIKTPALGYLHLIEVMYLALGSSCILQYFFQKEQNELIG